MRSFAIIGILLVATCLGCKKKPAEVVQPVTKKITLPPLKASSVDGESWKLSSEEKLHLEFPVGENAEFYVLVDFTASENKDYPPWLKIELRRPRDNAIVTACLFDVNEKSDQPKGVVEYKARDPIKVPDLQKTYPATFEFINKKGDKLSATVSFVH